MEKVLYRLCYEDHVLDGQPLPAGWEMRRNAEGREHFVNYTTKTTSWFPRSGRLTFPPL